MRIGNPRQLDKNKLDTSTHATKPELTERKPAILRAKEGSRVLEQNSNEEGT